VADDITLPNGIFYREIQYGDFIIDDWFQASNWPTSDNYRTALRSEKSHTSYTIDRQRARARAYTRYFTLFIIARFLSRFAYLSINYLPY